MANVSCISSGERFGSSHEFYYHQNFFPADQPTFFFLLRRIFYSSPEIRKYTWSQACPLKSFPFHQSIHSRIHQEAGNFSYHQNIRQRFTRSRLEKIRTETKERRKLKWNSRCYARSCLGPLNINHNSLPFTSDENSIWWNQTREGTKYNWKLIPEKPSSFWIFHKPHRRFIHKMRILRLKKRIYINTLWRHHQHTSTRKNFYIFTFYVAISANHCCAACLPEKHLLVVASVLCWSLSFCDESIETGTKKNERQLRPGEDEMNATIDSHTYRFFPLPYTFSLPK